MTLRVVFDFSREPEDREGPAGALLESVEKYRFVLTDGQFVSGNGFDINGTTATLSKTWGEQAEDACKDKRTIEMVLAWARSKALS